jgi:segregation and condensation protein B
LIEAALYVAGRPLDTKTLGSVIGTRSKRKVRELARALSREYSQRDGALELTELSSDRFTLQLKSQYVPQVRRLSIRPLLSAGPLKTLSYIAYNQPVVQSRVAEVRGSHAYQHIRELDRMGLVATEKLGRTKMIRITDVFADYFNLSRNRRLMKQQLKALFKPPVKESDRD